MNKSLVYILLAIIFLSCKDDIKKEYKNGVLYKSYTLNSNNEYDGLYTEYYKSGKIETIINYDNGLAKDSSVYYFEKSNEKVVSYFTKIDTLFLKYFRNNILESSGEFFQNRKIGYWNYYDITGKIIKKQESINLCGNHYINQSWEYDNKNKIIKDKGNHYQINLEKKEYLVGDTIQIKVVYTPALGKDSHNLIYVSPKIAPTFCNIKDVKLDKWYSENREFNQKIVFSTKGDKNLRGYIQEYLYQKERPVNDKYLYREVYFDIPITIK
jgi:antitoxin component YwqK of YwqJK toxin-antitoxin module